MKLLPPKFRICLACTAALASYFQVASTAKADQLIFNNVVADVYHAPINRGGSFRLVTDGVVDRFDSHRGFDTFNTSDITFAGLIQTGVGAQPQVFETVTLSLGNQFFDGGNFSAPPSLYLLMANVDTNTTLPSLDANWVLVTDAVANHIAGNSYSFTLTGSAAARTAYGFAIGGVQGSGSASFLSVSELSATGSTTLRPMSAPSNLVASTYHSPDLRSEAFFLSVDGRVDPGGGFDNSNGFDTFAGPDAANVHDFAGLLYSTKQQFDTVTLSYGLNFVDGGRFAELPRLFLNITGVDTDTTDPDGNPNWVEVTSANLFAEFDGVTFDLTGLPAESRQGFGWAIGGVNGDNTLGFISVSELSASGTTPVPEPSSVALLMTAMGLAGLRRRRSNVA